MGTGKVFVGIAGNIGAGKSTLTAMLGQRLGWEPFYEANAENPYLADFYIDMPRWSFHSQVFFLGKRLEHHRQLLDHPGSVVQDRTVYEDAEVFAKNLYRQGQLSERDYDAYLRLYSAICAFVPPPDLLIYLEASVDTLLHRIHHRGREYERRIAPEYLDQLNQLYAAWITGWTACRVVTINTDDIDFQNVSAHLSQIEDIVRSALALPLP
jgi:deoxyadenosine/deoxycytidine kinase